MGYNTFLDKGARDIIQRWRRFLGPDWDDSEVIRYMDVELRARKAERSDRVVDEKQRQL